VSIAYQAASQQWREADRRLADADPTQRIAIDRVLDEVVAELRRRLGSSFTTEELAQLYYDQGTSWAFDLAVQVAPGAPWAWDARILDAAFAKYVQFATDYAGGRRLVREDG
jgi:hypothetical protein